MPAVQRGLVIEDGSTTGAGVAGEARAFWVMARGAGEVRTETLRDPGPGEVLVRTVRSGISKGTERLVFEGRVPADQYTRMRAPFQEGDFPGPVKYGYLNVGIVERGPPELLNRPVFCLYPHQTAYVVPASEVTVLPQEVPLDRAVLAGTVETAVNALWDARPQLGDRVSVVGAGMVGCCVARLLSAIPGVRTTLVDIDQTRESVAKELDVAFAVPEEAPEDQDLVFHTSAATAGLRTAFGQLTTGGTVVELSWYGDTEVQLALGGDFHSRRLSLRASQVGTIPPGRSARWTPLSRRALAVDLLRDPAFDHLLTGSSDFERLPDLMRDVAAGSLPGICHTVTYR